MGFEAFNKWPKRVLEFRDRIYYLCRVRGITMEEVHLAYLCSVSREHWLTDLAFKRKNIRYFFEVILGYFSVVHTLENIKTREDFLEKYGLPDNTKDLIPKSESDYPKLLRYLGREQELEQELAKTKHQYTHGKINIQRPDQN